METSNQGLWIQRVEETPFHLSHASVKWTVKELKAAIQNVNQLAWDTFDLLFELNVLDDDRKLESYSIKPGNTIFLEVREGVGIMIMGGETIRIRNARENWTVGDLKEAIHQYTKFPIESIQLLFKNGMLTVNDRPLRDYNIRAEDYLILTRRPDGGRSLQLTGV